MKKIISIIKPFALKQNIFVYEDGNKIDAISTALSNIQNSLIETATKYEIIDIELIGSRKYLNGIANKIKEEEMAKYNEHKLNITIIAG